MELAGGILTKQVQEAKERSPVSCGAFTFQLKSPELSGIRKYGIHQRAGISAGVKISERRYFQVILRQVR